MSMTANSHNLGECITHKDHTWRIVRIVDQSKTLFEYANSKPYIIIESYAELKAINGDITHISWKTEKFPYLGPYSNIRALEPIALLEREFNE